MVKHMNAKLGLTIKKIEVYLLAKYYNFFLCNFFNYKDLIG